MVRTIGSPRVLRTAEDVEDFEQEIVDQYVGDGRSWALRQACEPNPVGDHRVRPFVDGIVVDRDV